MNSQSSDIRHWQEILRLSITLRELPSLNEKILAIRKIADKILRCKTEIIFVDGGFSKNASGHYGQDYSVIENNPAIINIPLVTHNSPLGNMRFQRNTTFDKYDIALAEGLATQVSILIENDLLYENAQKQTKGLSSVAEISNAITSILDLDVLLNSVASLIQKYFHYPYVYVFTVHRWQKRIQLRAEGSGKLHFSADDNFYDSGIEDELITKIVEHGKTILSNDLPVNHFLSRLPPAEAQSELIIPLIFGDQVLGILYLRSVQKDGFSQSDIFILRALSDNIAVALRNANLYRSEQWRRRVAESMRDIAGLLSADIDLGHLLNQLLEELTETLPCETTAIWLIESSEPDPDDSEKINYLLHLAALLTPNVELQDQINYIDTSSSDPWLKDILDANYPVVWENIEGYEPFGKLFGYHDDYSAIISRLWVGTQPLGILVLAHPQPSRYGSEAQSIVATFSSYAAVAIKNTQLYEAAHDQAWVSTVLLQVADATHSINDLDELVQTVVQIIPQLVGVDACAVLLWDKMIEEFKPIAAAGLTPEQHEFFNLWRVKRNEVPAFDHILASREPVIFNTTLNSGDIDNELISTFNLEQKIFILFPMVSQTDLQGALLVDYSENNSEDNKDLWDEKFIIIQGIAHQMAIAVENIRLIQSQEEEAYVSIALLQVAQAIVSATEIDDVLSMVTRITPILVAMRRCVIYLWDFQRNIFHLSQSYGIARTELADIPTQYKPGEFPLLESVRQSNHIACHQIEDDTFSIHDWIELNKDDYIFINPAEHKPGQPTVIDLADILRSRKGLLLAYPLAIKSTIYGVMITEEELTDRGIPSYHVRERRVEIVTGITQQVALAIQNNILQQEALQREILDRELQLAQEIQANFMPEDLPSLEGWDIDVIWKPARQVGGDYYDVFMLPDGTLGLVIADVADKGMPAALFMTLVRTLLRATARDNKTPSEALCEVNELLVPDAKNGMFVTLVYGIINPDNGDFVFANAGHVPPIIISDNSISLVELFPSGMALGVLNGIAIEEQCLKLSPGDCLLFYTDGVSEAFSPTGDMFGTNRLKQLIISYKITSVSHLLDMIVAAVQEFTSSAPISDDLTIVGLYRKPIT